MPDSDGTWADALGVQSLSHWTTRKVSIVLNKINKKDLNEKLTFPRKKSGSEFCRYLGKSFTKARKRSVKAPGQDRRGHG